MDWSGIFGACGIEPAGGGQPRRNPTFVGSEQKNHEACTFSSSEDRTCGMNCSNSDSTSGERMFLNAFWHDHNEEISHPNPVFPISLSQQPLCAISPRPLPKPPGDDKSNHSSVGFRIQTLQYFPFQTRPFSNTSLKSVFFRIISDLGRRWSVRSTSLIADGQTAAALVPPSFLKPDAQFAKPSSP